MENLKQSEEIEVYDESSAKLISCEFFRDFKDIAETYDSTRVYQLQVEKIKSYLLKLQDSVNTRVNGDQCGIYLKVTEDGESKNKQLIDSLSDELVKVTGYINRNDEVSMSTILNETCGLICKLEKDRGSVAMEIDKQKASIRGLMDKISALSRFKLEMLPSVVQKEHEACISDISELNWHIQHKTGLEKRLRRRRDKTIEMNSKIKEEMNEIVDRIPLVYEKLEMEKGVMEQIASNKLDLMKQAEESKERLEATVDKQKEYVKKVELERQHMRRDSTTANKTLGKTQKSLLHAIKEHGKLTNFKARCEDKILQNNRNIDKCTKDIEVKVEELESLEFEFSTLDRKERELKFDNKRFRDERNRKKGEFDDAKAKQDKYRSDKQLVKDSLEQDMVSLKRNNHQMELEIDTMRKKEEFYIQETEKLNERSVKAKEEILDAERQFQEEIEVFSNVSRQHGEVSHRFEEENRKMQEVEDKLRKNLSNVEQLIKQEILAKASFKSKIENDSGDLERLKDESVLKEKQMKKQVHEAQKLLKEARDRHTKISAEHEISCAERVDWTEQERLGLDNQESIRIKYNSRIEELSPGHAELVDKIDKLVQREEYIDWQVKTMNTQLLEIDSSVAMILKSRRKLQYELLDLEQTNNVKIVDVDSMRRGNDRMSSEITQLQSHIDRLRKTHSDYLLRRQDVLATSQREIDQLLERNTQLANDYRCHQTDFYQMQNSYLDVIQDQIWGEQIIKNTKQVQGLQHHMHSCLDAFYQMKLLLDTEQFSELQRSSYDNQYQVKCLEKQYHQSVTVLSKFIEDTFQEYLHLPPTRPPLPAQ